MVKNLPSNAGGAGLIPGWGSHLLCGAAKKIKKREMDSEQSKQLLLQSTEDF